jgi:hypothetical protein
MKQYSREDGLQCLAAKFTHTADEDPTHVFDLLTMLNDAELNAIHVKEVLSEDWEEFEDEDGDLDVRQIIIPEHIEVRMSSDKLFLGDYIVMRDGDTYVMDGDLFESVWSESITEDMDEWAWQPAKRLPTHKKSGYWEHKRDSDVVSLDGGLSYFRLSERPLYQNHGQLYKSAVPILGVTR